MLLGMLLLCLKPTGMPTSMSVLLCNKTTHNRSYSDPYTHTHTHTHKHTYTHTHSITSMTITTLSACATKPMAEAMWSCRSEHN